jgi:hypothetical protein
MRQPGLESPRLELLVLHRSKDIAPLQYLKRGSPRHLPSVHDALETVITVVRHAQ